MIGDILAIFLVIGLVAAILILLSVIMGETG